MGFSLIPIPNTFPELRQSGHTLKVIESKRLEPVSGCTTAPAWKHICSSTYTSSNVKSPIKALPVGSLWVSVFLRAHILKQQFNADHELVHTQHKLISLSLLQMNRRKEQICCIRTDPMMRRRRVPCQPTTKSIGKAKSQHLSLRKLSNIPREQGSSTGHGFACGH